MTSYTARVEVNEPEPSVNRAEALLDVLDDYHGAVGRSEFGRTEVTITVLAENLRQATSTALSVVATAGAAPAVAIEVMTTEDFDRRLGLDPLPELVSVSEAAAILGVSRQAVQQRIESGSLPAKKVGSAWVVQAARLARPPEHNRPDARSAGAPRA